MTKKESSSARIQAMAAKENAAAGVTVGKTHELSSPELMGAVLKHFCKGRTAAEICDLVDAEFGITLKRERPYKIISVAASKGWLHYRAQPEAYLREKLQRAYGLDTEVVHTAVMEDVAAKGAEVLLRMVRKVPRSNDEVHIGISGGRAMRDLVREFALLLHQPIDGLPESLVIHSMVAGFDPFDFSTDPNAYCSYFDNQLPLQVTPRFVALHAPPLVKSKDLESLKSLAGIKEAYELRDELDIIVTSAAAHEHSALYRYMERSAKSLQKLKGAGCVGDMLWRPIGVDGPIDVQTEIRAMTLMELSEFPAFIQRNKQVLLVLGPCTHCMEPKAGVLKTILNLKPQLVTQVVVDSRSARQVVQGLATQSDDFDAGGRDR